LILNVAPWICPSDQAMRRYLKVIACDIGASEAASSACFTAAMDDERPPICPSCGVTMVPAALSAFKAHRVDWICLECEEVGDPGAVWSSREIREP
jgi:hypothetical protein